MREIVITVTKDMPDESYDKICTEFKKKYPDCSFIKKTDDEIIGGFIVDAKGEIYDLSVASQLKKMQNHIEE